MSRDVVLERRRRKDAFFASVQSPLSSEARARFSGLAYYDYNPALAFQLELRRSLPPEPLELAASSGQTQWAFRWGWVSVPFPEGEAVLELYLLDVSEAPTTLFLPFRDATSGLETYEAGRYVDVPLEGSVALLDFNAAYSPTCAYAEGWTCPLPPRANWLSVAVRAGERSFTLE